MKNALANTLRVFEAFAGYGSQRMALERLPLNFETVGISEIDKYALKAYRVVHGDCPNFGDITRIDWSAVPDFDLFTYSFPCTDISTAGLQRGFKEGGGTRSGLLWECKRAIAIKRPKYLLMENVKALVGNRFKADFAEWQNLLTSLGYTNYTKVLNAKDYGVPQNRERVFMISILGEQWFTFPQPTTLDRCLADILEKEVNESYYLSEKAQKYIRSRVAKYTQINGSIAMCLTAKGVNNWTGEFIEDIPKILSYTRDSKGKILSYHEKDIANTIHTSTGQGGNTDQFLIKRQQLRKLTPKECFRLMDVKESDIDKLLSSGISNSQFYKMAGNSIVVAVLEKIFGQLLLPTAKTTLFG